MKTIFEKWGLLIVAVALWTALVLCCGLSAGEAQILDGSDIAPKPVAAEVVRPQTITVQAAAPTVNVAAAPAPQVTVQAAPAPNVNIQAPPPAKIEVNVPPLDLSKLQPPIIQPPVIQPPVTDWYLELTRIGTVIVLALSYLGKLWRDGAKGKLAGDVQDMIAFGLQWAKGDGPTRLTNALEIVRQRWRQANGGADMSAQQQLEVEHGIAAAHAASAGLVAHDPNDETEQEKARVIAMGNKLGLKLVATLILACVMLCSGCGNKAAQKMADDIKASSVASAASYKNITDAMISFYVQEQDAIEDARYQAALNSVTRTVKLADGTTIQNITPSTQSALARQHERNRTQIQSVADSMRAKILASNADAAHVEQLSQALHDYFATQNNVSVDISTSAASVMGLVQQFIPVKPAATKPAPGAK